MAWSTNKTWSPGEDLTAALLNTYLRDQFDETAPAIATTAGRMIVTDGANSIAERVPDTATVATQEGTAATSFTDLTTAGPAVTATTGTRALVIVSCLLQSQYAGHLSYMGVAVSGASTAAPADSHALMYESGDPNDRLMASRVHLHTGLTAGSNTFTAKYKSGNGTSIATFSNRYIIVIPF